VGLRIAIALFSVSVAAAVSATPKAVPPARGGGGLAITDALIPEFSGRYDKAFARLRGDDNQVVVAFVRGCPALTCATGPWEVEKVAHQCPNAYVATATVAGSEPDTFHLDLKLAGPAHHASTGTIEQVELVLTAVGNDGVAGSVSVQNTDATVSGSFKAEVCPRT